MKTLISLFILILGYSGLATAEVPQNAAIAVAGICNRMPVDQSNGAYYDCTHFYKEGVYYFTQSAVDYCGSIYSYGSQVGCLQVAANKVISERAFIACRDERTAMCLEGQLKIEGSYVGNFTPQWNHK